jgi:phage terminase large subunit-like protein
LPRLLVRAPDHDRQFSLGWLALSWMEALCLHGDGDVLGEPVVHGDDSAGLIVDSYALAKPGTVIESKVGRRLYDSVFYSRPKGADKSGLGGRISLFEALGPCRFDGIAEGGEVYRDPYGLGFEYVYEPGEPMGRPIRSPFIRCMATEAGQTGNVYDTIYYNLTEGPLSGAMARKDDAGLTRILLPERGEITPSTASSSSKDGGKETFVDFDESHLYNTPELRRMYATVTRNLRKRKSAAETWYLETTTMFAEGEESVAASTYDLAEAIQAGRTRRKSGLLLDHRWGECDDLTDLDKLKAALADAYGEAQAWMDLDALTDEFHDPRADPEDSRRYFLNARTSHEHAYVRADQWSAIRDETKNIEPGDAITLGFDGSRKRQRGVTDATALIGCRVRDGHLFEIKVWEQPTNWPKDREWAIDFEQVDIEVKDAFKKYRVLGFYADPAKWESYVAKWEARYRGRLKIKATLAHPIEWWMVGGNAKKVYDALESFYDGVVERQMSHNAEKTSALYRHVMNARRRFSKSGYGIHKEHPSSANKIDAAVAAVLAYQARLDALAKGVPAKKKKRQPPERIR